MKWVRWVRGKARFILRDTTDVVPSDEPRFLYAYSVVIVYKEGGWTNTAGLVCAANEDSARFAASNVVKELWDDYSAYEILDGKIHVHEMDATILEDVKRYYGLVDKLSIWREQLEGPDELDQ